MVSRDYEAAANRRPAGQTDGSGDLSTTLVADRTFPTVVAKLGLLVVFAIGVLVVGLLVWQSSRAEKHHAFTSPDGRFKIVVYRRPTLLAMPGQGSDAPGYFQLLDMKTGRVLNEQNVEMVQLVEQIHWSPTKVNVKLLADWDLPR